jgi:hypothetical protein
MMEAMRVETDPDALRVELSPLEQVLSVHTSVAVPYGEIASVDVDPEPLRRLGWLQLTSVGLRAPWLRFLCTTGWGRELWNVRRGQAAVRVRLHPGRRLRELNLGADDAEALAARIAERL